MDNRPAWVPKVEAAIARGEAAYAQGDDAYREAAEIIVAAMEADLNLTQVAVAGYIGHKPPYVSSLLKWHRAGYPPGGPFAAEIAARRATANVSTSKSETGVVRDQYGRLLRDGDYVQQSIKLAGGAPDEVVVDDERYAVLRVLELQGAAGRFTRLVRDHSFRYKVPCSILEALERKLTTSVGAGEAALGKVRAALKVIPRLLDAAE
jgi:hypothetical protein